MKIFHSLKSLKILLLFIVILSFAKCEEKNNLKPVFNQTYISNKTNFNFSVKEDILDNYNYLKLEVERFYNNEIAISFYQNDSNYNERKQLAYSFSNSTFMWLNKKQFKNNFYLSINCKTTINCSYNLKIYAKKYAELNVGDIYTY